MKFIAVTILLFKAGSYDSFQAVKISDPQPQINGPIILTPESKRSRPVITIAATLGADMPFCLTGGLAYGTGFGERITDMPET